MKMKLSNLELTTSFVNGLKEIASKQTSGKVAYNIAKTIKSATSAIETFESARKALIESRVEIENGKPKVNGTEYVFETEEIKKEAIEAIQELSMQEVEVDVYPITIFDLGRMEITGVTLLSLRDFIKDEEVELTKSVPAPLPVPAQVPHPIPN